MKKGRPYFLLLVITGILFSAPVYCQVQFHLLQANNAAAANNV